MHNYHKHFLIVALGIAQALAAASYVQLDPQVAEFLTNLAKQNGPPIYTLPVQKARKILDDIQAPIYNTVPADIKDMQILDASNKAVSVRLVRPKGAKGILPGVIYMHGGGWILGNKLDHDSMVRRLANGANVVVVFVNYSLSPEAQHPVAIEQGYAVAQYVTQHAKDLGINPHHLIIAGDSVGGLMATEIALRAKERGGPKFEFQLLLYPVTNANFNTASYKQFGDGNYWLSTKSMQWFWDAYLPDAAKRQDYRVCPLRATLAQLKGLPPTLLVTDANDVLRDEGEAYGRRLKEAGVPTQMIRIDGTIHDFMLLAPLNDSAPTKKGFDAAIKALKNLPRN